MDTRGEGRARALVLSSMIALVACGGPEARDGADGGRDAGATLDASSAHDAAGRDGGLAEGDAATTESDAGTSCPEGVGGPPATTTPPMPGSWTLTFQDDFLASGVDDSRWKIGGHWAGFNGIAANDPSDVSMGCGYLTLRAEHRDATFAGETRSYAAAELSSFKRFRQQYGYFEARVRYDGARGLWPAFWLMPDRGSYGDVDANRMAYMKFDLGGIDRASVESATLQLRVASAAEGVEDVLLARVLDDAWSEGDVTWSTRPAVDPLFLAMRYGASWSGGETVTIDVTEYVNRELAGDRVASFAVFDTFERATQVAFASRESADAGARPTLIVSGAAPIVASEDATVAGGAGADTNMGSATELVVYDAWADGSSTYDGGMEIDIMESLGVWGSERTAHTVHWDGYGSDHRSASSGRLDLVPTDDGFHTYGVSWQPGVLRFFVDGRMTWEWDDARVGSVPAYMLLSLQVGGWADDLGDNTVPDDAALPAQMVVDYVRVWSGSPS